jgi:hypothetical protein
MLEGAGIAATPGVDFEPRPRRALPALLLLRDEAGMAEAPAPARAWLGR